jgi:uncharacterized membrane protein YccC
MATVSNATTASPEQPDPWVSLWRTMIRFDTAKLAPWIALRNVIGMTVPLALSVALGNPAAGTVAATGALNVSFTDGTDPYFQRGGRMLAASFVGAIAVLVGGLCGHNDAVAIVLTMIWAFAAGMLVLNTAAGDIGLISLVTLVVFTARPMTLPEALYSGALALAGGLLQTSLALALWPVRRSEPERRAIGDLYVGLSHLADASFKASEAPPASAEFTNAHKVLSGAALGRFTQAERYWSLLSQAERIRLSLLMIARLRTRLEREPGTSADTAVLDRYRRLTARVLLEIGESLLAGGSATIDPESLNQVTRLALAYRESGQEELYSNTSALAADAHFQIDALAGQLRAATHLAAYSTPAGRAVFERREAEAPWTLRLAGTLATLRANLSLNSAVCRHAVRLSLCVAIGDSLARLLHWPRSYWMPMTIAIILKPDFTATFSRGVMRLIGTFVGLVFATALFHTLAPSPAVEVLLIAVLAFFLRCFGPANYGIFVVAISALVVLLFALTGVEPAQVIAARGLNTAVGGLIALVIYGIWPTWERSRISESIAQMLDGYRDYFHGVRDAYIHPDRPRDHELDRLRLAGRLGRSNLEASVERFTVEPGVDAEAVSLLNAFLASSHRLVHAMMALEAGLTRSHPIPPRDAFVTFANHVELTLHSLAESLRGSELSIEELPDLRADHHALVHSGDVLAERYALVNVESDRITNSLNTVREQLLLWKARFARAAR